MSKRWLTILLTIALLSMTLGGLPIQPALANNTTQALPFAQNWSDGGLISSDDDWSLVPGIIGYRGDGLTGVIGADPQTILADGTATPVNVNANETNPDTFITGGVAEFTLADPVIALQGSGTADAPFIQIHLNTSGASDIQVAYTVRDIDGSADDAVQPVALHYRVGASGNFTNIPAAYIADATTGGTATQVTPINITLPAAANNQPEVQLRIMTTNADGSDEWVGIDDIAITGTTGDMPPTVAATAPANGAAGVAANSSLAITFSEDVTVAGNWFSISCASSGAHPAVVSGGPRTFTLDPVTDFTAGESCTAVVTAAQVSDQDGDADPMAADYTWSFTIQPEASACTGLFFSEYVEGSGDNKALEIYNGTNSAIDLSGYRLETYFNGASTYTSLLLQGSVASGDVFVVAHQNAALGIIADQTNNGGALDFNGDDAIVLRRISNNAILDVIGQVGTDPGTEWGSGLASTADNTLRRNAAIATGDATPSDAFNPAAEWTGYTTNTFDGLGSHTAACFAPTITRIHAVQGSGTASPLVGQSITIEGIVIGDFQDTVGGFFVQEEDSDADSDPLTSEGIFVYSATPVSVGDAVRVTGEVVESYNETQIASSPLVSVISSGNVLPALTEITLPIASLSDWENYEGMRVSFPQNLVVIETYHLGRGGVLALADQRLYQPTHIALPGADANAVLAENMRHGILLDDGSEQQNPDPIRWPASAGLSAANTVRSGDRVSGVQGILTYRWSGWSGTNAWRIYPTGEDPTFTAANPRPTAIARNGQVRVASFNVLNYFNGDGAGGGFPTARGATTPEEFTRQRDKIISAILALDADIIGLMEIENDGYGPQSAIADLVSGLNEATSPGTYAYINPGTATFGGDEIAVSILYRPAVVSPSGSAAFTDSGAFTQGTGRRNRQPLAQTFTAAGEVFTVVVNHFKSKGSACDAAAGPFPADPDTGDGQGNCNLTRNMAAADLRDWLATNPTGTSDPDYLILGDLNAYAREDPLTTLAAAGYTNLARRFWGDSAYSYVFTAQIGSLDYALANAALLNQVTFVSEWHINADEPTSLDYNTEFKSAGQVTGLYAPDAYRASDHDPLVIDLFMPCTNADVTNLALSYGAAWHCGPPNAWLGANVDTNTNFLPGGDAADNDGIERLGAHWQPGAEVGVGVTVNGSGPAWLAGWFDWNRDGDFTDPGEQAINRVVAIGQTSIPITIPVTALVGQGSSTAIAARFRLYESASEPAGRPAAIQAAQINGTASGGEVEDYTFDFGPTAITLHTLNAASRPATWGLVMALLLIGAALVPTARLLALQTKPRTANALHGKRPSSATTPPGDGSSGRPSPPGDQSPG